MNVGVLGGLLFILFVSSAVITHRRSTRWRRLRSRRRKGSSTGQTFAVHDPSDDPHWQEYSKRKSTRKAKRRRVWAAGTAGAVGAGSTDAGGSCSAGCGGGCGGG